MSDRLHHELTALFGADIVEQSGQFDLEGITIDQVQKVVDVCARFSKLHNLSEQRALIAELGKPTALLLCFWILDEDAMPKVMSKLSIEQVSKRTVKKYKTARLCKKARPTVAQEVAPMSMVVRKPQPTAAIVPDGSYRATLTGVKAFENSYGERIGFEFTLHGGKVEGSKVMRSCSPALSLKSKLADVIRGLLGRDLTVDEISQGIDLERFIGAECMVLVLQGQGKMGHRYSNVERVYQPQEVAA